MRDRQRAPAPATPPASPRVEVILGRARAEARRLDARSVGAEHLLLGLLVEDQGISAAVVRQFGVDREIVRHRVHELIRLPKRRSDAGDGERPWSTAAVRVLRSAGREAERMDAETLGVGHLLLALVRERSGIPGTVLAEAGLRLGPVRRQVKLTLKQAAGVGQPERPAHD